MKNDNKGRDIFYGVVAVATLIVAIVGATLAYFSVSASSNEGAVNAQAATVSIEYSDGQQVTAQADKLIPADFEDVVKVVYEAKINTIDPSEPNAGNACIDSNNQQVCSAYRFTVKSDVTRTIAATLNNEHNGFTYLGYAIYDVTNGTWLKLNDEGKEFIALNRCSNQETSEEEAINDCHETTETGKKYLSSAVNSIFGYTIENDATKNKTSVLEVIDGATDVTQTYDIVLFINENNDNQNIDQGQEYHGTIIVDVVDTGLNGQITGYVKPEDAGQ